MGLEGVVDDEDLYPGKTQHRKMIDFLEYWIAMIVTYARGEENFPKIILIGTHRDKIKTRSELEQIKTWIYRRFNDMITSSQLILRDELFIQAHDMSDETRNVIRDVILEEGKKYKEFGERIPSTWIELQEKFMEMKKKNQYVVGLDKVQEMNSEMNVSLDDEELKLFLMFLHNMGYVLYFNATSLSDKIILDPKLVIDAMRSFITCERFIFQFWKRKQFHDMRRSGRVQKSHILKMMTGKGQQSISKHTEHLLTIMKKLDLICEPMIYKKGEKVSPDFYLVPCMMNASIPHDPLEAHRKTGHSITFCSETILPPAIFNRLVCSCLTFWEIHNEHFYNGLVILRSGKFHLMEMKRDIKQIVVTFAHTQSTKSPDVEWCSAIKLFLTQTINYIVKVYSTTLEGPISCISPVEDAIFDMVSDEHDDFTDGQDAVCPCSRGEYNDCQLLDVTLMRIAQQLRRVDLHVLCTALLNDADFSNQIEADYRNFKGDVKAFYVLQEWKHTTQRFNVTELKGLLREHIVYLQEHIICQAIKNQRLDANFSDSTILFSNVYDEFLDITADRVTYKYLHLGLELGLTLTDIECLKEEKDNRMREIARALLMKWYKENMEEATVHKLAMAFQRCGVRNLEWMQQEFDIEKSSFERVSNETKIYTVA